MKALACNPRSSESLARSGEIHMGGQTQRRPALVVAKLRSKRQDVRAALVARQESDRHALQSQAQHTDFLLIRHRCCRGDPSTDPQPPPSANDPARYFLAAVPTAPALRAVAPWEQAAAPDPSPRQPAP